MHVQFWLNVNIENTMTRLRPTGACCCIRSITFNAVTNGTNTHMHVRARAHTHTHTNHNQSREITNIKSFAISISKHKVIEVRSTDIVCVNKQNRVSDY